MRKNKKYPMKTSIKISLAIIIVLGLVISEIYLFKNTRPSPLREERIIYIPPQTSFKKVAQLLKRENIITNVFYFTLYARWHGAITKIKSGELLFYSNAKPREVLNILLEGHPVLYAAVIPEGWNIYEIADRLSELQLVDRDGFLKTCFDKEWLTKINVKGPSCEGYLFPETYQFSKYLGEQKIIQVM
ncbi:MAG: endolytic transglycosylase MltG, partial [Deltaproteobacteria bacterium]|nr:endolytic transglycosylase MltG [Deltaproteobacteria bacterium]